MSDPPPNPQLEYSPSLRGRPKHPMRWVWITLIAVPVLVFSPRWVPAIWRHAQLLAAQRACAQYTLHPDRVVYESDHAAAAALLKKDTSYEPVQIETWPNTEVAGRVAPEWRTFHRLHPAARPGTHGTVFMHELRRPDGTARLVFVDALAIAMSRMRPNILLCVRVLRPASLISPPAEVTQPPVSTFPTSLAYSDSRLFAGQIDAADPSHFTIAYVSRSQLGVIDGYLRDDDSVKLEPRR
jgi:hypothetical protein